MIKKCIIIIWSIVLSTFFYGCLINVNDDTVLSVDSRSIEFEQSDYGNQIGNNSFASISQLPFANGCIVGMFKGNYVVDYNSLEINYLCSRLGCSHDESPCVSHYRISNLQFYENMILCRNTSLSRAIIYSIENNEIKPYIDLKEDFEYFIRYKDYLIVTGINNMLRVDLKTKEVLEINKKPNIVGSINCYDDKIYFCEHDFYLYETEIDGSGKRLLAKQAIKPQAVDSVLYYLEREEGSYNLIHMNLKTEEAELILDNIGMSYNVSGRDIFYTAKDEREVSGLYKYNLDTLKITLLKKEYRGSIYVCDNSDWIFEIVQFDENGTGISDPYINAIKKDGSKIIKIEP